MNGMSNVDKRLAPEKTSSFWHAVIVLRWCSLADLRLSSWCSQATRLWFSFSSLRTCIWSGAPTSRTLGSVEGWAGIAPHRSSVKNEMSVLDSVRNGQRRASQQAPIHSDFTLILLTLVQAAGASPCGSTRLTRFCRAPAPTMVSNTQHLQLCQEVNKWFNKLNYFALLCLLVLPPTVQTLATGGGGGWGSLQPPPSTDAWIMVLLGYILLFDTSISVWTSLYNDYIPPDAGSWHCVKSCVRPSFGC